MAAGKGESLNGEKCRLENLGYSPPDKVDPSLKNRSGLDEALGDSGPAMRYGGPSGARGGQKTVQVRER